MEGGPFENSFFSEKKSQRRKKLEVGPFSLVWFCTLRLKSKK